MKKIISMMVAMLCATTIDAQVQSDIRTATLMHGEQTSVFYGAGAFVDAYNASADGDVIVLSSGEFNAPSIRKSVSIYGAGYETDPVSGAAPTFIKLMEILTREEYDDSGEKKYVSPTVLLEGLSIGNSYYGQDMKLYIGYVGMGIIENIVVRKCKFANGICIRESTRNCTISQCVIMGKGIRGVGGYQKLPTMQDQLNFDNCWISDCSGSDLASTITYDHCILTRSMADYAHFTNSILFFALPENCTAHHNIFTTSSIGSNVTGEGNWTNVSIDGIFADADQGADYTATNDFTLRFPAKYVGTDGTEVGINGGVAPFNRISPIPRILSSDIDLRTTAEGKLNVSIQVEAQTNE